MAIQLEYYKAGLFLDYVEVIIYPPKPQRDYYFGTQEGYEEMTDSVNQIVVDFGVVGGVRFVHTTATNRHEGASYAEYEKLRQGLPARIRYNPHIQAVGLRKDNWRETKAITHKWRQKGWFVRILYADGRTGNKPWNSVARKISYELGHADQGYTEKGTRKQFTTWFGIAAYNNCKITEHRREEVEKCKCGLDCWLYWEDERRDMAIIKHVERTFTITLSSIERAVIKYKLERGIQRYETICAYAIGLPGGD